MKRRGERDARTAMTGTVGAGVRPTFASNIQRGPYRSVPVCVVGMHRSGTSLVSALLVACGVTMGPREELITAGPDNHAGFWEDPRFKAINEELLTHMGGAWDRPPVDQVIRPHTLEQMGALRDEARALVATYAGREPWGWKDPRTSLTLRFWLDLLPDLKVVICIRHPREVAASLRRRNGTDFERSVHLWSTYNRALLHQAEPQRRLVTHYGAYVDDFAVEVHRLAAFCGLTITDDVQNASADAVVPALRHHRLDDPVLADVHVPDNVADLYAELCTEAEWTDDPSYQEAPRAVSVRRGTIGARRDEPRLVLAHHRLNGMNGHRLNEALAFRREAKRRDQELVLFIHQSADAGVRARTNGLAVLHDPVFVPGRSFDQRTTDFVAMLDTFIADTVRSQDRLYITVATQCEARAAVLWLRAQPADRRPWTVLVFHSDRWNRAGADYIAQRDEFAAAARDLQAPASQQARAKMVLCAVTAPLAEELCRLLGVTVMPVPLSLTLDGLTVRDRVQTPGVPLRAALLGGARAEKGAHLWFELVQACRQRQSIDFVVQLMNETLEADAFERLTDIQHLEGVAVVHGPQDPDDYVAALEQADLAIFPYEPRNYRLRGSAVFGEVVSAGIPVVTTPETWMAAQVTSGNASGTVAQGLSPAAIADAVTGCIARYPALAARAQALAPTWVQAHSLPAFFDTVEVEIARRVEDLSAPVVASGAAGTREIDRRPRIRIACIGDHGALHVREMEWLFRSVARFGGSLADAKRVAYFVDEVDRESAARLRELDVEIRRRAVVEPSLPAANALLLLEDESDYDVLVALSTDTVVCGDFSSLIRHDSVALRPAEYNPLSIEQWSLLFGRLGVEPRPVDSNATLVRGDVIGYFDPGIMFVPRTMVRALGETWLQCTRAILPLVDELPEITPFRYHAGQFALALALAQLKLPLRVLPLSMNLPTHDAVLLPLDAERFPPLVVRHHHRWRANGTGLLPSSDPATNMAIERLNQALTDRPAADRGDTSAGESALRTDSAGSFVPPHATEVALRDAEILRLQGLLTEQTDWNLQLRGQARESYSEIRRLQHVLQQQVDWNQQLLRQVTEHGAEVRRLQGLLDDQTRWNLELQERPR